MATDYSKKKNAELEDLLRARSLPHTGKKADLIARLVQHDAESSSSLSPGKPTSKPTPSSTTNLPPTAATTDDTIDWDSAEPSPTTTAALAAGGMGQSAPPPSVPNQAIATDPATTNDLTVTPGDAAPDATDAPTTTTPAAAPAAQDFTQGLTTTSVEAELVKRKARAARFGLPADVGTEAEKALERAKRFGTAAVGGEEVKALDSALPERAARKRGRGEGNGEGEKGRAGKRVDSRRREGRGRKGDAGTKGVKGGRAEGKGKEGGERRKNVAGGGEVSEKDRLAAEARKKRFAAAAAT